LVRLDPDEFLPSVTLAWCSARLKAYNSSLDCPISLSNRLDDGTLIHEKAYHVLRTALEDEVFSIRYSLPRCLPPEGAYNWTPPSTTYVETLTIPGEEILLEDVLTSSMIDQNTEGQTPMSGDDDTDTDN